MLRREKERARFLVARPTHYNDTWHRAFWGPPMIDEFFDSVVRPDVQIPSISRRVAAVRIFYCHQLRRTLPQRQLLHAHLLHMGAWGVPINMEREKQPIIIVDEKPVNFALHDVGFAGELRLNKSNFHRL